MADYFRDFAPIISVDPLSNTVYLLFHGLSRTWNIPDKVIFDYEISREERDINAVVITNGVEPPAYEESEEGIKKDTGGENCSGTYTISTVSKSENSETTNTYLVDLSKGIIRLTHSRTVQYGTIPVSQPYYWINISEWNFNLDMGKVHKGGSKRDNLLNGNDLQPRWHLYQCQIRVGRAGKNVCVDSG